MPVRAQWVQGWLRWVWVHGCLQVAHGKVGRVWFGGLSPGKPMEAQTEEAQAVMLMVSESSISHDFTAYSPWSS